MNRRIFLRGIGGAALAAPFLSSLAGRTTKAQEAATPRRLVIFYTNNGCLTNRWFPDVEDGVVTATSLQGKTLEGLAPYASKLLFPRGLAMFPRGEYTLNGVSYFDPHDQGMGSKLTCAPIDTTGSHYALSHSLDHEVARLVNQGPKSPLVLAAGGFFSGNVKAVVSYAAGQDPYAPETNPRNVYNGLTGLFQGDETEADYRVARGESIIDLVDEDLQSFKRLNMSSADQKRVDDWLQLLRETEVRVIPATCNAEAAEQLGITSATVETASRNGMSTEAQFTERGDMLIRLIALTMMCDNNRSIVMQWPGFVKFDWLGHDFDHHGLSHRNGSNAVLGDCVAGVLDQLKQIDDWYAARYVQLVGMLDSIVEGDGTLLDNCACMWLPELADGNAHNNNNLPIVIAGSCGGYLKQGASVNLAGGNLGVGNSEGTCQNGGEIAFNTGSNTGFEPLNKLYVTLLNAVGATAEDGGPITTFGTVDSNNLEAGITKPGEFDALKA